MDHEFAGEVLALSNFDPVARASVLARGIVGTRPGETGEVPFVASPIYQEAYDLRTGRCLDDEALRVPTYDAVIDDGMVLVGSAPDERAGH